MPEIRVLVVDDHAIRRDGIRSLLERQEDIRVVGEAANGREAWPARVQIATLPLFAAALALTVPRGIGAVAAGMASVLTLQSALLVVAALRAGAASWVAWARSLWSGLWPRGRSRLVSASSSPR